jgi:hypothetical protein
MSELMFDGVAERLRRHRWVDEGGQAERRRARWPMPSTSRNCCRVGQAGAQIEAWPGNVSPPWDGRGVASRST